MNASAQRLALALLFALAGCGVTRSAVAPPRYESLEPEDVLRNCGPFGAPQKTRSLGPTRRVVRPGYVVEHSDARRLPLWVAQHLEPEALGAVADYRRPRWRADPALPPGARAEDDDYRALGGTYDRGHLAPAADFATRELRDATFFLSNAVPQDPGNNRGLWAQLEKKTRAWVAARSEAWVVTGALWSHPPRAGALTAPSHLFKVVLARRGGGFEAIAFLVENRAPAERTEDLTAWVTTIDRVEEAAGLDLFPLLPEVLAARLEGEKRSPLE